MDAWGHSKCPGLCFCVLKIGNDYPCNKQKIVTNYFDVKRPTQEEYEDQDNLKIELMAVAHLSSPEFIGQEQIMLNYR